jgi:hypothetical protein
LNCRIGHGSKLRIKIGKGKSERPATAHFTFAFSSPKNIHEDRSRKGPIQMDPFDFSASGRGQPRGQEVRRRKEPFGLTQFRYGFGQALVVPSRHSSAWPPRKPLTRITLVSRPYGLTVYSLLTLSGPPPLTDVRFFLPLKHTKNSDLSNPF